MIVQLTIASVSRELFNIHALASGKADNNTQ